MTEPNAAEWLSAWSTLWGAIAGGVGAIGTAGALWLGAVTFRRQVQDNHRAQAKAVTVTLDAAKGYIAGSIAALWNNSGFPIYSVVIVVMDSSGKEVGQDFQAAVPPQNKFEYYISGKAPSNAYATFIDSSGSRWRRYFNGDLEELKRRSGSEERAPEAATQES